ncbi:MAG: UDP-N-acetylmuramoyl-L-alanyl-D-glutamate--2,6-diaminopimelate ligase [Pseudomonadota bacterium]
MKLNILAGLFEFFPQDAQAVEFSDIAASSSEVLPGTLFFGLPGTNVDGSKFVGDAWKKGAVAAIVSQGAELEDVAIPVLKVPDPRYILAKAAEAFYCDQPKIVAAVTGTAGKTSVATFLRQIWEAENLAAASLGTTGVVAPGRSDYGNLTTPDPISLHKLLNALAGEGVTHAAMEASSHGLDQRRLDGVRLSVAGFTNLGRDHLDYHATIDEYLEAKLLLFNSVLPAGKPAVVFADDAFSQQAINVAHSAGRKVCSVGRAGDYIALKKVEHRQFQQIVDLEHGGKHYRIEFPLAGDFQIANALVAAGMALATGSDPETVFKALENLKGASGRLELVGRTKDGAPTYVDYAHKPEALENVLTSLRPFTSGRLFVVFGCGGDRDPGKRPIMGEIAERLADVVIVTDDNPRTENPSDIRSEILVAAKNATEIPDRAKAIEQACAMLKAGDCLVVAGKGHEEGQIVGTKVLPFSDHAVLSDALNLEVA